MFLLVRISDWNEGDQTDEFDTIEEVTSFIYKWCSVKDIENKGVKVYEIKQELDIKFLNKEVT